ncbi:MAG TPA: hypothetical protein DCR98_15605, partial [Cobetia sp.]|nr:hypothetical protein [Cobetia sp.]
MSLSTANASPGRASLGRSSKDELSRSASSTSSGARRRWWQRKPLTPDQALGWLELRHLFIGQCLVLALHVLWMPVWLALPALLAALWRFQQLRARVPRAGILLRLAAVAMVAAGLFLEYGQMLRLE